MATTNASLKDLNRAIGAKIPGDYHDFRSADSVRCQDADQEKGLELKYPQELLNSMEAGSSLPDHLLSLKKGFIVMLFETFGLVRVM